MKLNKDDITALTISIIVHILLFLFLYFCVFKRIIPVKDDGIYVNFGDFVEAKGEREPQTAVNAQQLVREIPTPKPKPAENEEMITQTEEETVHIPNTQKKKEKLTENKPRQTPKQPTEEERLKEERRKREEEQKRQEGNIKNKVTNAFNRTNTEGGTQGNEKSGNSEVSGFSDNSVNTSQSQGEAATSSAKANQGSPFGNSDSGPYQGVGGFGSFSLSGRTLREGGLHRPNYTVEIEGKITIDIIVDFNGNVIRADIGKGTNIADASMRNSALDAARKAKFNKIKETNNQNGTITYIYKFSN
ncbi:MAG: TonB family protein [Tannerella sp.]|jgi:TonB family protein|nr:TonB family protein [Tannerella sp.]